MDIHPMLQSLWELILIYGLKALAGIVILIVGRWVARGLRNLVQRMMRKADNQGLLGGLFRHHGKSQKSVRCQGDYHPLSAA
jgi:hypothetical protein